MKVVSHSRGLKIATLLKATAELGDDIQEPDLILLSRFLFLGHRLFLVSERSITYCSSSQI